MDSNSEIPHVQENQTVATYNRDVLTPDELATQRESNKGYENLSINEINTLCGRALTLTERYLATAPNLPTLRPAVFLSAYNLVKDFPDASDLEVLKELGRLKEMATEEIEASQNENLPTIGIEIEVLKDRFPMNNPHYLTIAEWFKKVNIRVASDKVGNDPTEFSLPPSYSAASQSKMLLELQRAGFVPTDNSFASLHVSLGVPEKEMTEKETYNLSDVLTYAYVPARRVREHSYETAVEITKSRNITTLQKSVPFDQRVEFRTPRVFGGHTDRLLEEMQLIGSLYLGDGPVYDQLRSDFSQEAGDVRRKYLLSENAPQGAPETASDVIEHAKSLRDEGQPNLIDDARDIMTTFSQRILNVHQNISTLAAD